MNSAKNAFIVMPIRKPGTDDYQNFRALYDEVLKPTLEAGGFVVERADDIQKTGAIGKDIVLHLAEADLVVADLTDLNPNVFYELGVRHVLRGVGTVMILDELKTAEIPFDLSAYRVIRFRGELNGIGRLRTDLLAYAKNLDSRTPDLRDNPVHDWLPALPINSLEAASGTSEGKLREELAKANAVIRQYEKIAGFLPTTGKSTRGTPLEIVTLAVRDANEGNLASDLIETARATSDSRNNKGFLAVLQRIMERSDLRLRARDYDSLAGMAINLELGDVASAILAHGLSFHPQDQDLRRSQLSRLAHSPDGKDRQQAREELAKIVGVDITQAQVRPPEMLSKEKALLMGIMLDTYDTDGLHDEELRIARAFAEKFPDSTVVCRNMARALSSVGKIEDAWKWYKKAISTPDATDSSATWYGSDLHNNGQHVDAMESYLIACRLDPNDGMNFANVADELAHARFEKIVGKTKGRALPRDIDVARSIRQFVQAAFSCRIIDLQALNRCRAAARSAEINIRDLEKILLTESDISEFGPDDHIHDEVIGDIKKMSLEERVEIIGNMYEIVRSDATLLRD